jgi:hypothetical protein
MEKSGLSEGDIKELTDALYGHAVDRAKERIVTADLQLERIERIFSQARLEADRSSAILMFALAEDMMLSCFKNHFNPNVSGGWETITGVGGLIGTAANRLVLLELLYWITSKLANDLRLMKSIRNRFAHHADIIGFQDQKISSWIASMQQIEKPLASKLEGWGMTPIKLAQRELYLLRSLGAIVSLACALAVEPIARQERINSRDVFQGFDQSPDNLRAAMRLQATLSASFWTESSDETN